MGTKTGLISCSPVAGALLLMSMACARSPDRALAPSELPTNDGAMAQLDLSSLDDVRDRVLAGIEHAEARARLVDVAGRVEYAARTNDRLTFERAMDELRRLATAALSAPDLAALDLVVADVDNQLKASTILLR